MRKSTILRYGGRASQAEEAWRQAPAQLLEGWQKGQGDCCTVNEGKRWEMSLRGRQVPQHIDLEGQGQDCGSYSNCSGKLLEGSQQRGDVVGFMFLMITLMLCKEQSMRGGCRKDEWGMSRSQETKLGLPQWFGWAMLVAGRDEIWAKVISSHRRLVLWRGLCFKAT